MALPIIPAVLMAAGAGLVAYEAAFKKKSGASPSPTPGAAPQPGAAPAPQVGPAPAPVPGGTPGATAPGVMPPELRAAYNALLAQADAADPDQLDMLAEQLAQYGFTTEAATLKAKAAQIRARRAQPGLPVIPPPAPAPIPVPVVPAPSLSGDKALVTAPSGVAVRAAPSASADQTSWEAKQGVILTVVNWNAAPADGAAPQGWAQVRTPAGVTGYATKQWLQLQGSAPSSVPLPPAAPPPPPGPATVQTAMVTAPSGIAVRAAPAAGAAQTSWEAKQGVRLTVLNWNAAPADGAAPQGWAQVRTPAGVTGYATKQWLQLQNQVSTSGVAKASDGNGRPVTCLAPQGCRIRQSPSPNGKALAVFPNGETAQLVRHVTGPKGTAASPGPGGWCLVRWAGFQGWVPSEWMRLS